jgi:hypothetical protein
MTDALLARVAGTLYAQDRAARVPCGTPTGKGGGMNFSDPKEFQKVIDRHKANLASLKATFSEQAAMLEQLKKSFKDLGLDENQFLSLSELPPEMQSRYLEFERDLKSVTETLSPSQVKPKGPKLRPRLNI